MLKIVRDTFRLKSVVRPCDSFNATYDVFCLGCLEEYIVKITVGKTKLRKSEYMHNMNNNLSIKILKLKSIYEFLKKFFLK